MADEPLCYDGEEWKPVNDPRFGEPLEASSYGRVRRMGHRYLRNGRPGIAPFWSTKKPRIARDFWRQGYPYVNVKIDGRTRGIASHILVCLAFHGAPPSDIHEVAHSDGQRENPTPGNLRWATPRENEADKVAHGTRMQGVMCHLAKLTDDSVVRLRLLHRSGRHSLTDLASVFNVHRATVSAAVRRRTWKHVA